MADKRKNVFSNPFGAIYSIQNSILLVEAKEAYIPIESFKELFEEAGKLIKGGGIEKLIFDKRNLQVFHQPSMEWYFVEWKEEMFEYGLTQHRKILPLEPVFRECVKLGRENLGSQFPTAKFHQMDIQYRNSIEEAVRS